MDKNDLIALMAAIFYSHGAHHTRETMEEAINEAKELFEATHVPDHETVKERKG